MEDLKPPEPDRKMAVLSMLPETLIDVQDGILTACTDLERLVNLFSGACAEVNARFVMASSLIDDLRSNGLGSGVPLDDLQTHLSQAIVALQIDDMATQLVDHTRRVLRHCADTLASSTFADAEGDEEVIQARPLRPSPVTQSEMDAGSIELF